MGPILHILVDHITSERTIGDDPVRAGLRRNDAEAHTWNSRPGGLGLAGKPLESCGDIVRHIAAAAEPPTYAAGLANRSDFAIWPSSSRSAFVVFGE